MNENAVTALIVLTSVTAIVSVATLVGGIALSVKLHRQVKVAEEKYEGAKNLTKKFVADLAQL